MGTTTACTVNFIILMILILQLQDLLTFQCFRESILKSVVKHFATAHPQYVPVGKQECSRWCQLLVLWLPEQVRVARRADWGKGRVETGVGVGRPGQEGGGIRGASIIVISVAGTVVMMTSQAPVGYCLSITATSNQLKSLKSLHLQNPSRKHVQAGLGIHWGPIPDIGIGH